MSVENGKGTGLESQAGGESPRGGCEGNGLPSVPNSKKFENFKARYEEWLDEQWRVNYGPPRYDAVTMQAFKDVAESYRREREAAAWRNQADGVSDCES